ncbi:MAG: leucine-rich repeat domain-containing protein, partial [Candidatus Hermodarchaeota archaeon]
IPEAGLEAILTEKDMFAFRNAIGSELLKKMGPSRLIPLFKNPSLNFSSSVLQILPVFKNKQYREGYIKFLKEIEDLSSIPIITETDYEDKQKMREILAEKDQLKHLDREKFWNLFPKEILRLREIEDISHYSFSYMSHKYVKSLTSGKRLSFSLRDDQLIFFSGAYCKLKDEQVRKIFDIIVDFPLIIRLCLNHNNFQTLPEEIGLFKNLEAIGLAYAGITSLPDSIGELTSLEQLEINYNHLTELPNSIGNLTSLKKLYINSINQITQLPNSIGNLKSLENLSLSWNPLTSLPDTIGNLIHLSRLSIEACPLKTLPESIGNLTSLAYLHMAETKIETLPISMKNLKNLKFIQVSNHLLHDMPKLRALMKPLKNLEVRIGFESLLMGNLMSNEIF